ncbi:hypothetical protein [Novipirellula artificiosorum]|uniref:hypothetical protein n=1 Tax=Novipirellula artificiosorum TaxID=2528016 RepID=UPI0018CCA31F|nr:hypothetical protein [Novipirellula artificiosorum]
MTLEQLAEEAFDFVAARRTVTANGFATAGGLDHFATTGGFDDFATASWLRCTACVACIVTMEQFAQQSTFRSREAAVAARLGTTSGFEARCWSFAATGGLDVTTRIASAITQFVKQAKRAGVDRAASDESDSEQSRNEYTTHRGISKDLGFRKV